MDMKPQGRPSLDELVAMRGRPVVASDGHEVGKIKTVFYDESTGEPEWIGVAPEKALGGEDKRSNDLLVPFDGAAVTEDYRLQVPYDMDKISRAPEIATDVKEISQELEHDLYAYYSLLTVERRRKHDLIEDVSDPRQMTEAPTAAGDPDHPEASSSAAQRSRIRARLRRRDLDQPLAPETGTPLDADEHPEDVPRDKDSDDSGLRAA